MLAPDPAAVSLLHRDARSPETTPTSPDVLRDLALDQLVDRLAATTRAIDLGEHFAAALTDADAVRYRQDVFRDLRDDGVRKALAAFEDGITHTWALEGTASQCRLTYQRELWHLRAVTTYAEAITTASTGVAAALDASPDEASLALRRVAAHLATLAASAPFVELRDRAARLVDGLAAIRLSALVRGARVTVAHFDDEPDLGTEVLATFERFRQADAAPVRTERANEIELDRVQGWILERVAGLNVDYFDDLIGFAHDVPEPVDPVVGRVAAELRFYFSYLDLLDPLEKAGLATCLPEVSTTKKALAVTGAYDLVLARRLVQDRTRVITNDLSLAGDERILVISGPNQGGKTTTSRIFGQLHHLAALGCPVPGADAVVFVPDKIVTQFEREEGLDSLEGKLGEDLARMHRLLDGATGSTVVVLNEVFSSTTLDDARFLTRTVLDRLIELDALAVCVTFIDELSRLGPKTVSMVSTVDPEDPTVRTFEVVRRPADGRAYALALAEKYGLTYDRLSRRVAS